MKKAIFCAILAISTAAFTQNYQPTIKMQHRVSNSMEYFQSRIYEKGKPLFSTYCEKDFLQTNIQQTQQQDYLVQMNDSILQYPYIIPWYGWDSLPIKRKIEIKYDNNENLTGYTEQIRKNNSWLNSIRYSFSYDGSNNLIGDLYEEWTDSAWLNIRKITYTFNDNNQEISELLELWKDTIWSNSYLLYSNYDDNYNLIHELGLNWDFGVCDTTGQLIYTYDSLNNQTSLILQWWMNHEWKNEAYVTFFYDENNIMNLEIDYSWSDNIWLENTKRTFYYDQNYNLLIDLLQSWNGFYWQNLAKNSYTYDEDNNMRSYFSESSNGESWFNVSKGIRTYDSNSNLLIAINEDWWNDKWIKTWVYSYHYDENNFRLAYTRKHYSYTNNQLVTVGDSLQYYFHVVVDISEKPLPKLNEAIVYPNPGSDLLHILFHVDYQLCTFQLYDMKGKRILQQNIAGQFGEINTAFLPPGIYIYLISNSNGLFESGKWVRQ